MVDALVSALLDQLVSFTAREAEQEVRLVVGVDEEVKKLTSNLQTIKAVLNDAEKRQVMRDEAVELWLDKLKDTSYDMDDVLDEWNTEILKLQIEGVDNAPAPKKKVCSFIPSPCSCLSDQFNKLALRHDIAHKIKDLNETLDEIAKEKEKFMFESNISGPKEIERPNKTTSLVDVSSVIGRDNDKVDLVNNLLGRGSQEGRSPHPHVISLVGMGGIGKTTLAQQVYNDDKVKAHFEIRMWVCVSNPFDQSKVAKAIIQELERESAKNTELKTKLQKIRDLIMGNFLELESLLQSISSLVEGRKFFLVLDDVWTEDEKEWEPFKLALTRGDQGSRILVTTRNENVAMIMGSVRKFNLKTLSEANCWLIFSKIAFYEKNVEQRKILEDMGRQIALKCKGLPLAAKTLGSLMRSKKSIEQWQDVLHSSLWELKESRKDLFAPLLLSYFDLPSPVKRCFTYCAVFPKDYCFDREEIVKLWMAQGYLDSEGNMKMEIAGREYFQMLAMRSFFQDFRINEDGSIINCKMHDIVHDHAQSLMKNECCHMIVDETEELEANSFYKKFRHLNLTFGDEVPAFVYEAKTLRTLLTQFRRSCNWKTVLLNLFCHLTSLRALDLSGKSLKEVPKEVKMLIHLRYLNLSHNGNLKELPETMCDLYNLQILNVSYCRRLEKLPQAMGKLRNLRHLILEKIHFVKPFPKGFGRLSSLITLNQFVVCSNDDDEGCKLGELKNLNHLRGELEIKGLGNLIEVCEAENAQLKKKKHLNSLDLIFGGREENRRMENDEALLNALEPHPDLEILRIAAYRGTAMFRNWSMSIKLKTLWIWCCNKLECLPPLGRLPFLESLALIGLKSVKNVGVEFLGIDTKDERLPSSSSLIFFPNLKSLNFMHLEEWEEWDGIGGMIDFGVTIMPHLYSLQIWNCPKLKALPRFIQNTPLNQLDIRACSILGQRCERMTKQEWPKISHIPNIKIDNLNEQGNVPQGNSILYWLWELQVSSRHRTT